MITRKGSVFAALLLAVLTMFWLASPASAQEAGEDYPTEAEPDGYSFMGTPTPTPSPDPEPDGGGYSNGITSTEERAVGAQASKCDAYKGDWCDSEEDWDCLGGTGDGPNYIEGPVELFDPEVDPFKLDENGVGDGIGCEDGDEDPDPTPTETTAPPVNEGNVGGLPETGVPTLALAGFGVGAIALGFGLFAIGRNRNRVTE